MAEYDREAACLARFLPLNGDSPQVREVIGRYRPGATDGQSGLHFHLGRAGRFRESFSGQEQTLLVEKLGAFLPRMGYAA